MATTRIRGVGDERPQAVRLRDQARDRAPPRQRRVRESIVCGVRASVARYRSHVDEYLSPRRGRRASSEAARQAANRSRGFRSEDRDRDFAFRERAAPRGGRILGKIAGLEVTETTLKVRAVDDLKAHYPLPLLLRLANLPRSTFYDHRRRLCRPDSRTDIKEAIRDAFAAAKSAYGHRRIRAVLHRQGWTVSKKTVLKLMRELGLQCPVRRRKRYNSFRGDVGEASENVLNREFATKSRHTKWVTDVTEFTIGTTKVYLSPVMDLHDNRIISTTAGPSPSVKMVTDGLRLALDTLSPGEKPLVHSDQGFQYRHTLWRDTLRKAGLTQSMSRKGTCLDNAAMEGFFSHLKEEWFRIQKPETVDEFHAGLNDYLRWWNTTRLQQRLGYLSPDEYRDQIGAIT
ncbi:MAG: IS3 family transposase [Kineosporiaceae bacterium]|nr:IS3 family transposase [Aeromicrobium sp.]